MHAQQSTQQDEQAQGAVTQPAGLCQSWTCDTDWSISARSAAPAYHLVIPDAASG